MIAQLCLAVHPEPVERRLAPRTGPDPRLRARDHPRHRRRDLDRRAALAGPRRPPGEVQDLAVWAVPFGLVGGRLYHVATDHELYFGADGDPWQILYVWRGGLGVWGSIFLGAVGGDHRRQRRGMRIGPMVDALAPGLLVAQALGPLGQLVQPGAVRQAHRPALGARDRPRAPAARLRGPGDVPPDVPLRVRLEPARLRGADRPRPPVQVRPRPDARPLRDGLHARPRLDRDAAHRHRRARATCTGCGSTSGPRSCCSSWRRRTSWSACGCGPGQEESAYVEGRGPQPALAPRGTPVDRTGGAHDPESTLGAAGVPLIG